MLFARSGVSLLFALAALAAAPTSASADPPAPDEPRSPSPPLQVATDKDRTRRAGALNDEAALLYEEGRYRAAVAKLEAALRVDPDGHELIYNLAVLHEKLADMKEAAGYYRRYLETETDPKARARVQATLRRIEGAEKEAAARGPLSPVRETAPSPPASARPVRPWVIATGTVAGASFVIGSALGFTALVRNPGPNARTGNGVTFDELQSAARVAHTDAVLADISFLITAAAAGTAAFLYFSTPRSMPAGPAPARTSVAFGPGRLRVRF